MDNIYKTEIVSENTAERTLNKYLKEGWAVFNMWKSPIPVQSMYPSSHTIITFIKPDEEDWED